MLVRCCKHSSSLGRSRWLGWTLDPAARRSIKIFTLSGRGLPTNVKAFLHTSTTLRQGEFYPQPLVAASDRQYMDEVWVRDQSVKCVIGCNPDERERTQDLVISMRMWVNLRESMSRYVKNCDVLETQQQRASSAEWATHAAAELAGTHDYSAVAKIVKRVAEEGRFFTIEALAQCLAKDVISQCDVARVQVIIDKPGALVKRNAAAAGVVVTRDRKDFFPSFPGAHTHTSSAPSPASSPTSAPNPLSATISYPTFHAAVAAAAAASCEPAQRHSHIAYLALGSNVGDRISNIHEALRLLQEGQGGGDVQLLSTSFLYESPAAYVTDQAPFINAACKVCTCLPPLELLDWLKSIERRVGREERYRWGPREVDLDIIFYDSLSYESPDRRLRIPHPRAHERDFVLGPLCDISPGLMHPERRASVAALLQALLSSTGAARCALTRIAPISISQAQRGGGGTAAVELSRSLMLHGPGSKTAVMGILNVTPDSFSDGGRHGGTVEAAVRRIEELVAQGADIVDIGGQSTRPGASLISESEELSRVVPVIAAARAAGVTAVLSVDTFRAAVARQAVAAGADMINDVSGGSLDPGMFAAAADLAVPTVLMHYRGDPATMQSLAHYPPGDEGTVTAVARELEARVAAALRAGVARWNVITDPGIGFAKTPQQSLACLRRAAAFAELCRPPPPPPDAAAAANAAIAANTIAAGAGGAAAAAAELVAPGGFAVLVGPSRKGFVGAVLEDGGDAAGDRRLWGTGAAVAAAVQQRAAIVRVHDVTQMRDVVAVADAVYPR